MNHKPTYLRSRAMRCMLASLLACGVLCLLPVNPPGLWAHKVASGEETTTMLASQLLPDVPGKQWVMAVVSYAPGQSSAPHRHPGSVMGYGLEGEVTSQLEGQPPITYRAAQSWYEPPRVPHLVSKNASNTAPAKLLAVLLLDAGAPGKELLSR